VAVHVPRFFFFLCSGGGVEAYVDHGRIKVTNTLDTRLETACEQILPAIRNQLFGIGNGTRAFFN